MHSGTIKIGVLASGALGAKCLAACNDFLLPSFIATDSKSEAVIKFAKENNIPVFAGNPRNGRLSDFIGDEKYDIIFSINYLFLLEKDVIAKATYPINFHGSLLPRYRGRTPHVWSIINSEKKTGVTAHVIDEGCDTGAVVLQKEIAIEENDTGADLLKKYEAVYPGMINEVLQLVKNNSIVLQEQDNSKATIYGKRTPEDGAINWNWQKERIRNWVRAQADPYPGAFTRIDGEKVIIDEIGFSDHGYADTDANGQILSTTNDIIVKTPNGAIALTKIRNNTKRILQSKIFQ